LSASNAVKTDDTAAKGNVERAVRQSNYTTHSKSRWSEHTGLQVRGRFDHGRQLGNNLDNLGVLVLRVRLNSFFRYFFLEVYCKRLSCIGSEQNTIRTLSDPLIEIINDLYTFQTTLPACSGSSPAGSRGILLPNLRKRLGQILLYFERWLRHVDD